MDYIKNPIVTEEHLEKFAQSDFYIEAWRKKRKWNWGALFLNAYFLLYRKMYLAFFVYMAVYVFLILIFQGVNINGFAFELLFIVLLNVPLAIFSNEIYLRHAEKKIEKIIKSNPDEKLQDYHIEKAGGTSLLIPIITLIVVPLCLGFLYAKFFG
jgi:hypothetical protein